MLRSQARILDPLVKKLLITNVVYGPIYSDIFLNQHLKSLLDETNVPAHRDRIEYVIFTDAETKVRIEAHPNFKRLANYIPVKIGEFAFPVAFGANAQFDHRYTILIETFRISVEEALRRDTYLSAIVADLVFAKGYFDRIFLRLDAGFDSVFVLPLRSAAESIIPELARIDGACEPLTLCKLGYENLHPLWVACHWDAPQFTKLPFTLLWNTGTGLLARSFSITPIAFSPTLEMLEARAVIDIEIPGMCKNPFWATDWIDAPVIGVEPLFCYYPTFANRPANSYSVLEWSRNTLDPSQFPFLRKELYYPSKEVVIPSQHFVSRESNEVVNQILGGVR